MKKLTLTIISVFIGIACLGQGIEFYGSLITSGDQRFQPGYGVGLQYQRHLSPRFVVGVGISNYYSHAKFDQTPYVDANPGLVIHQLITSDSYLFAVRLNIQGVLIDHNKFSITLGPTASYNVLWGRDQVKQNSSQSSDWIEYSQENGKVKDFGVGLMSSTEFKNMIASRISLCVSIRSELFLGNIGKTTPPGASAPPFFGILGFSDFQIGLKYRLKK